MPFIGLSDSSKSIELKQLLVICLSNAVAYFDFLIFLYMADIISATIFPTNADPLVSKLQALSLFVAGYLARPIGGFFVARLGDKKGRKPALLVSLSCIATTTLLTACLPSYHQAGIIAPILFFIARILQGAAFGAHAPLGWVYVAEHVRQKNIATFCSLVTASFFVGAILSSVFFTILTNSYSLKELIDYAWRTPFIFGALFSFISLVLWKLLDETPIYLNLVNPDYDISPEHSNILPAISRFRAIFLGTILTFIISSLVIIVALILPDLILLKFSIDSSMLEFSHELGLLFLMIGCVFYGLLADKSNTGKAMMIGAIVLIVHSLAFYYHLANGGGNFILFMYAILGFCAGIIGLGTVIIVQLFPTQIRLTAVSLIYNIIYAIVGGLLPFIMVYATNIISFSPALYLIFIGIVAFIIGFYVFRLPKFNKLDEKLVEKY